MELGAPECCMNTGLAIYERHTALVAFLAAQAGQVDGCTTTWYHRWRVLSWGISDRWPTIIIHYAQNNTMCQEILSENFSFEHILEIILFQ